MYLSLYIIKSSLFCLSGDADPKLLISGARRTSAWRPSQQVHNSADPALQCSTVRLLAKEHLFR